MDKQEIENSESKFEEPIFEEQKEGSFEKWFKKTTKGREKKTIYIMFSLMVIFTVIIILQGIYDRQDDVEFDVDKIYKDTPLNLDRIDDAIFDYKTIDDAKKLFEEYEFLIKQDTLDTLRIKNIETILNEKLLKQ